MPVNQTIIYLFFGNIMLLAHNYKTAFTHLNSGVLALIATLIIWSSYFVALRSGAQSSLTGFDMALLRFMLPAVLLLPFLIKSRKRIASVPKRYLLGIAAGAGLPFYLFSVLASGQVQAVIGSLLVPGVSPLLVTIMAILFYKERLSKQRMLGLFTILGGIAMLIGNQLGLDGNATISFDSLIGMALYLCAAGCWAVYTVSVKMSKLNGLEIAAILNCSAAAILLCVVPSNEFSSNLANETLETIVPQLLIMGVFCGLITVITYGHAISRLGAEITACWGAMTPILVAILAFLVLGEALTAPTIAAMALIIMGVVFANFRRKA
jgi:drug/metabolite transporter (DMT)-like permease